MHAWRLFSRSVSAAAEPELIDMQIFQSGTEKPMYFATASTERLNDSSNFDRSVKS